MMKFNSIIQVQIYLKKASNKFQYRNKKKSLKTFMDSMKIKKKNCKEYKRISSKPQQKIMLIFNKLI